MKDNKVYGFTLIEVLIALVIICLVMTGFSRVIYSCLQARKMAENKNSITDWAQTVIEYMKTEDLTELHGEYSTYNFPDLCELKSEYDGLEEILVEENINIKKYNQQIVGEGLYKINVIVNWEIKDREQRYKLSTLLYKGGE